MEGLLELRFPNLWSRIVVTRLASLLPLLFFLSASRSTVETIASAVNVLQVSLNFKYSDYVVYSRATVC